MDQAARDAERLEAALQAAEAGNPVVSPESAPELGAMVAVAEQLRRAGGGRSGDPRPSFVLGLEEHLRTEFRLQPPQVSHRPWWSPSPLTGTLVVLAAAGTLLLGVVAERSGPNDPLWGLHGWLDQSRVMLAMSPGGQAEVWLDIGWRHLHTLEQLVERQALTARALDALLPAITGSYDAAVRLALATDDERLRRRVGLEAGDAADLVHRLSAAAPPGQRPALAGGESALQADLRRLGGVALTPGGPTAATATLVPTALIAIAPATVTPAPPTALPTQLPTLPPTPRGPVAVPSTAPPPTSVPATATAALPPPEPTEREATHPSPTSRASEPPPAQTDTPQAPPSGEPPTTPTPDRWPATSVPSPAPGP